MIATMFRTPHDVVPLVLRVALGGVMFPHGAQKLFGWFGGPGFSGTLTAFQEYMGIPAPVAFLVIVAESFGALGLIAGLLTRLSAFGIGAVMVGAIFQHVQFGFFMNWAGTQKGEGFEYHLLAIGISVAILIRGGGAWSLDRALIERRVSS